MKFGFELLDFVFQFSITHPAKNALSCFSKVVPQVSRYITFFASRHNRRNVARGGELDKVSTKHSIETILPKIQSRVGGGFPRADFFRLWIAFAINSAISEVRPQTPNPILHPTGVVWSWCAISVPCASRWYTPKWAFLLAVRVLPCGLILEVSD
jgi:hypothetical protein